MFMKIALSASVALLIGSSARADFLTWSQPTTTYLSQTTLVDFANPDYTAISSLSGSGLTLSYSSALEVRTVPLNWNAWNSPPAVEIAAPRVGYTNDHSSLTISFSKPVYTFGLEIEPDNYAVEEMTAAYYANSGLVGTIDLVPNGNGGALLFAASTTTSLFTSVVITNLVGDDFAVARQRFSTVTPVPEPTTVTLLGLAFFAAMGGLLRKVVPKAVLRNFGRLVSLQ